MRPYDLSRNISGVPPYYMLAFAVDGTPTTNLIGTGQGDLLWTVNQPAGMSEEINSSWDIFLNRVQAHRYYSMLWILPEVLAGYRVRFI